MTATRLKNATGNTLFMPITRNNASDWKQANVKKGLMIGADAKTRQRNLKQFAISVTNQRHYPQLYLAVGAG